MRAHAFVLALALVGCSKTAATTDATPAASPVAAVARDATAPPAASAPIAEDAGMGAADAGAAVDAGFALSPDATLTLERTACYGTCPVYQVTLYGDGRVAYRGTGFVRVHGPASGRADPARVRALFEGLERDGFFGYRARYATPVTDNPTHVVTAKLDGRTKRVEEYASCDFAKHAPAALCRLEEAIDDVAGTAKWIPCKGGCQR